MKCLRLLVLLVAAPCLGKPQAPVKISAVKAPAPKALHGTEYVVRGVVTYIDKPRGWYFLHDDSGDLLVIPNSGIAPAPAVGSDVVVTGQGMQGAYAPYLHEPEPGTRQLLGTRPLPGAVDATAEDLHRNRFFSRFARTEGWVMDVTATGATARLMIASPSGVCIAQVESGMNDAIVVPLRGAKVRVTGFNWTEDIGDLRVRDASGLEIMTPAADPGSHPSLTASTWPAADAEPKFMRLPATQVHGVVGRNNAVRIGDHGLSVTALVPLSRFQTRTLPLPEVPYPLARGDLIEAAGLMIHDNGEWRLFASSLTVAGKGSAPLKAHAVAASEILKGNHWSDFVRLEGSIVRVDTATLYSVATDVITIDGDGLRFRAFLPRKNPGSPLKLDMDRRVEVTGLAAAQDRKHDAFNVWCDSSRDFKALDLTPGAMAERWRGALIVAVLVLAMASGWLFVLRMRMRRQSDEKAAVNRLNQQLEQRVAASTADLRAAEAELRKALSAERELSKLKTNFVSMVSHEFRTPLGIISVNSELLNRYRERLKPGQMSENLTGITNAVKRMSAMMENILVLSRVDTDRLECKPSPMNLPSFVRRLIDEMNSAMNHSHDLQLSVEGSDVECGAQLDEAVLRHILTNLISNACKYSPDADTVDITLRREDQDAVLLVRDYGIGILDADRERLFESFHRGGNVGQIGGTGLGLVIVKRCVDLHGGSITMDSEEGKGTTFTVRIAAWR